MNKKIISVSRRTDIPAFYGEWFLNRVKQGFACWVNPFNNTKYEVSLKPENVLAFIFWSKNYMPFIEKLELIKDMGYKFIFHYTINNYPAVLEQNVPPADELIDNLKILSTKYGIETIYWRYDPIIFTDITNHDFHLNNFYQAASKLKGYVDKCYFSFVDMYGKVKKHFDKIQKTKKLNFHLPGSGEKMKFAEQLAQIAGSFDIKMYTCCCDYLISSKISKGHCIDYELINRVLYNNTLDFRYKIKPTRKECGCSESTDIGAYNTCIHGCDYCYANINKKSAYLRYKNIDNNSPFL